MNAKPILKGLILLGTLVLVGYVLQSTDLDAALSKTWIDKDVRGHGVSGELLFIAVAASVTALGLPRQIIAFLSGYAFGFLVGTGLAAAGMLGGCIIAFTYARLMGRSFVAARFPAKVAAIDEFLHDNPLVMTLLIRFLPVGSNLATNLAAGVSRVPALPFFVGSGVGYLPQTVIFALMGSGISVDPELRITVAVALFLVSTVLGVHLYRRYRHDKHLETEVEEQIGGGD